MWGTRHNDFCLPNIWSGFFLYAQIVSFVEVKKMWSQAVFGKMSKSSHFFPWWEIYYFFKQDAQQNPPWRWGLFWYSPNILVEAVFETPHNVLVDKHTPVFLFIEAWSTSWRNSHICDCRHGLRCIALHHLVSGSVRVLEMPVGYTFSWTGCQAPLWNSWSLIDAPKYTNKKKINF